MKNPSLDPIRAARFLLVALLAASTLAHADARPRTAMVKIGPHPLKVEVVSKPEELARGLMYREKLGRDEGMLFLFDSLGYHSMWMKNTLIPLSVAFVDAQGTILNILDMEPHSEDLHMSAGPSVYAIEVNKGWFEAKKVKAGDKVTGLPKK
jgi:uncharacterized membrane protein (UPF0127 family)